ncbi:unnamed protein product [Brugia pahangi]|uniref:Uncharacterized protein n=1 Tax=Brugia pahangi TaxID=6280 RepID=A0A0N4SY74_BRUPA|nr:unnamed protein product [Brugia pahangi]
MYTYEGGEIGGGKDGGHGGQIRGGHGGQIRGGHITGGGHIIDESHEIGAGSDRQVVACFIDIRNTVQTTTNGFITVLKSRI